MTDTQTYPKRITRGDNLHNWGRKEFRRPRHVGGLFSSQVEFHNASHGSKPTLTSTIPAEASKASLSPTRCGNWSTNDAAIPPPCMCSDVSKEIRRYRTTKRAYHRYAYDIGLIPSYVLHQQCELGDVKRRIVCGLRCIRIAATVQVWMIYVRY